MNSSCLAVLGELRQGYHRTRTWGSTSNVCGVLHMGEQLCLLLYILTGPLSGQRLRSFQPCEFHVSVSHLTLGCGPLKASLSSLAGPAPEDSTEKAGGQESLVSSARSFSLSVHSSAPAGPSCKDTGPKAELQGLWDRGEVAGFRPLPLVFHRHRPPISCVE